MVIFMVFLPLKGQLVAAFNKIHKLTFRKYVTKQGINIPKKITKT